MYWTNRGVYVVVVACLFVWSFSAGVVAETLQFADTEFADGDWIVETAFSFGAGATLYTSRSNTAGNPGACQITSGYLHSAGADAPSGIWRTYLDADAVWDPASMAALEPIQTVSATFDTIVNGVGCPGAHLRLIACQDGHTYGGPWALSLPPRQGWIWNDVELRLEAMSLGLLESGGFHPEVKPDLSPTGAAVTFGFMLWQELTPGAPEAEDAFAVDNWSMRVRLVPEPATCLPVLTWLALACRGRGGRSGRRSTWYTGWRPPTRR